MKPTLTQLLTALLAVLIISCNDHKEETKVAIKAALKNVNASMDAGKLDNAAAYKADSIMQIYINKFPKDTLSADFILKSAQLKQMEQRYNDANKLLDKLVTDYPDSKAAPVGLYLNGFIFENNEGLLDKAKSRYELFLKKYPNSELVPSVKASLENLGKNPEDIIKGFESKPDTAKVPS